MKPKRSAKQEKSIKRIGSRESERKKSKLLDGG